MFGQKVLVLHFQCCCNGLYQLYHVLFGMTWIIYGLYMVAIMLYTTLVANHVYTTIWSFFLISKGA